MIYRRIWAFEHLVTGARELLLPSADGRDDVHRSLIMIVLATAGCTSVAQGEITTDSHERGRATMKRVVALPTLVTYDPATAAPSAMQEARGTLAVEKGCVVLREASGTRLLLWRRPARTAGASGAVRVEQMGRTARVGGQVTLTGTGGNPVSATFAREHAVPQACRGYMTFAVNGILTGEAS